MSGLHEVKRRKLQRLYERDGDRCHWCTRPLIPLDLLRPVPDGVLPTNYPTLDHIRTQQQGGGWADDNLVIACPPCNRARGGLRARSERWQERVEAIRRAVTWTPRSWA